MAPIVLGGAGLAVAVLLAFLAGRAGRLPQRVHAPVPERPVEIATVSEPTKAVATESPRIVAEPEPKPAPPTVREPLTVARTPLQPATANPQPRVVHRPADGKPSTRPFDAPPTATGPPSAAASGTQIDAPAERPPILGTADLIELVEPAVVRINALDESGELEWHGSGFVVDPSGIVVTNAHVVAGAAQCVAVFENGTTCTVKGFYSMQDKNDIAVVAIEPPKGSPLASLLIAPETPRKGETVFAFGCPHGLDFTASDGIVSSIRTREEIEDMRGEPTRGEWLQTTAPISEGNSGGPLVNERGEVVGVNSMVHRLGQNLNFAVGAAEILAELDARPDTLTSLSRSTAPQEDRNVEGIDLSGTPLGAEKLAGVKKVAILALTNSWAMRGRTVNIFRNTAKDELKRAGIEVVSIPSEDVPVLFVGIVDLRAYGGPQQMAVRAFLVVVESGTSGLPKPYTVWKSEAELGSTRRGRSLGDADLKKIKEFFRGLVQDHNAAVQVQQNSSTPSATPPQGEPPSP